MLPPFSSTPASLFAELRSTPADASPPASLAPAVPTDSAPPALSGAAQSAPIVFADLLAAATPAAPAAPAVPAFPRLPAEEPPPAAIAETSVLAATSAAPGEESSAKPTDARPSPCRRPVSSPKEPSIEDNAPTLMEAIAASLPLPAPQAEEPEPALLASDSPPSDLVGDGEPAPDAPFLFRAGKMYSKNGDGGPVSPPAGAGEDARRPSENASSIVEYAPASAAGPRSAVFAGPVSPSAQEAPAASRIVQKNTEESPLIQRLALDGIPAGMEKAKDGSVMSPASSPLPVSAASRRVVETVKVAASSAEPASGTVSPSADSASAPGSPNLVRAESLPVATPLPAAAARLVERIDEVAERLSARPTDHVEISLDLDGSHRVDVKIALRGGRVFADFRTDSPEMRAALTQAWDGFVRGRDASAQRWADPVFSSAGPASSTTLAPAPASESSGSFEGDPSARQDSATDQRHAPPREFPSAENLRSHASSASARTASAPAAASAPRVDASRLLSAVA